MANEKFSDAAWAETVVAGTDSVVGLKGGANATWPWSAALTYISANLDATLVALAAVTFAANKGLYATGPDAFATFDLTAAGRALLDDADAAAQRATLGLDAVWRPVGQSSVAASVTGTTSETTLATIPIAAGAMGNNGRLRITALWTVPNNANNKTARARLGVSGPQVITATVTTQASLLVSRDVGNRNSASAQVCYGAGQTGSIGPSTTAVSTFTVNTAAAFDVCLTATLGNSADTMTLESYSVEILYAA